MSVNMAGPAHTSRAEVVIGGAGFAGLALAIALRQGLGDPFAVTVIDPALAHAQSKDPRASAIAAAARRLFEAIDVWDAVAADAQPILDMVVTDQNSMTRCDHISRLWRGRGRGRAICAHDREPAPGGCTGDKGEGTRRRIARRQGHGF
jgi:2-polyprenyl-6-methoxyphenol hydroxylase-like FAD-dependent oxidoreductase